ncbi:HAD hydrolase-like protein [Streptomyces sp. NPDC055107]
MKPNPHSLIAAAERLDVDVSLCALIGDSLTDIQAAHAIGSRAIGSANKPHKRQLFVQASRSGYRLHASHRPGDQPPAGHLTTRVARICYRFLYLISRHPAALRSAGRASRLWLRPRSCLRPARRCRRRRAPAV